MYWLIAGLFALGAACGATVRLPFFVIIVLGGGAIVVITGLAQGSSAVLLSAVIVVVTLQIGYAAGTALGAAVSSWRGRESDTSRTTIGEKRQ
jgi:hypothetical protein